MNQRSSKNCAVSQICAYRSLQAIQRSEDTPQQSDPPGGGHIVSVRQ